MSLVLPTFISILRLLLPTVCYNKFLFMLYRKKIYILIFSLLVAGGLLFGYGFGLLDQSNAGLADQILVQKKTLLELQAEQTSFEQSKRALDDLLSKPYQPENFFSNDINLVHEIKTIEA